MATSLQEHGIEKLTLREELATSGDQSDDQQSSNVSSSESQPSSSPTEEPGSPVGELDQNDSAEIQGEDVVGASGDSPVEGDAGPFNISGYQKRLPPGVRDEKYGIWNPVDTFTPEDSNEYDLNRGERLAVIFNHLDFVENRKLPRRNGTVRDCEAIDRTFKSLNFNVIRHDDLTVQEIRNAIYRIQHRSNLACLALFILTHGEENGLLFGRDTNYRLNKEIIRELLPDQCPTLAGKPKMIFIQACQGEEVDGGTKVHAIPNFSGVSRSRHTSTDGDITGTSYCIPNFADFLIFQASYHGHYSFRSASGSWFIQTLCDELEKSLPKEDLLTILTRVSRKVAITRVSNVPDNDRLHDKKQIPLRQDTLIRSIYLKLEQKSEATSRQNATRSAGQNKPDVREENGFRKKKTSSNNEKCNLS